MKVIYDGFVDRVLHPEAATLECFYVCGKVCEDPEHKCRYVPSVEGELNIDEMDRIDFLEWEGAAQCLMLEDVLSKFYGKHVRITIEELKEPEDEDPEDEE